MSKHITEFDLQDAKTVVGNERLERLSKVQDAIEELEHLDVKGIKNLNEIYGKDYVEKTLKRLYDIKDRWEYETNVPFGINVTIKFSQVVEAETYKEAVEIVKDNFWNDYKIELEDFEIDPIEFDLRSVLNLLDANGYEDASNFLQLYFAEADEEFPFVVSVLDDQNNPSDNLDSFALLEDAIDSAKHNAGTAVFKETCNTEKNTCDYELVWHPTAEQKLVKAYQKYLQRWYADHSGPAFEGMEPVCFDEFIHNEYLEEGEKMGYRTYLNLRIYGDDAILDGKAYPTNILLLHNYSIGKIYMEDIILPYDKADPDNFGQLFFYDEGYTRGELTVETFINIFNYSKSQRPEEYVNVNTTWEDVQNTLRSVYLKLMQWIDAGLITYDRYIEFEVY